MEVGMGESASKTWYSALGVMAEIQNQDRKNL